MTFGMGGMGRFLAILTSAIILALYLVLASRSSWVSLFSPRGGIVGLTISLLLSNAAIWIFQHEQLAISTRVQLRIAGWTWLVVQLIAVIYLLVQAG